MANGKVLMPIILQWEGGFVDDKIDRGGATNKGITLASFVFYRKINNLPVPTVDDLKNISEEEWFIIFKTLYWDKWKADTLKNQSVANILVDWVWASGIWGIKIPQRLLGLTSDGIVGDETLTSVNNADQQDLFNKIHEARLSFVEKIVANDKTQVRFINGWLNRINYFKFQAK